MNYPECLEKFWRVFFFFYCDLKKKKTSRSLDVFSFRKLYLDVSKLPNEILSSSNIPLANYSHLLQYYSAERDRVTMS